MTKRTVGLRLRRGALLWLLLSGPLAAWAAAPATNAPYLAASTRRMGERLQEILRKSDPMNNSFLNNRRVEILEKQLQPVLDLPINTAENLNRRFKAQSKYAIELLNAGKTEKAIEHFQQVEKLLTDHDVAETDPKNFVRSYLAIAYLRLGEQENCLALHGVDSCIFPLRGGGIHAEQRTRHSSITYVQLGRLDEPREPIAVPRRQAFD